MSSCFDHDFNSVDKKKERENELEEIAPLEG